MIGVTPASVLCLHGGGRDRTVYANMRQRLLERGMTSVALDFPGQGESDGPLDGSSLRVRTEAAIEIIKRHGMKEPLTVFGISMGAYTAVKLTELYQVEHLILLVPAAYAADAYDLSFGTTFTDRIRMLKSWEATDSFGILSKFTGRLLIIVGGLDEIIPRELVDRLLASAVNAKKKELMVFEHASHQMLGYLEENADEEERFLAAFNRE